tara:strand:- start:179 stop:703 length:525 start_codon:yes stop_codon:yes gene_type:complete
MGKICTKCKVDKLKTEFYKHKNGKGGLNPVCKVCWKLESKLFEEVKPRNKYRKQRYKDNKTEINRKQVIYNKKKYHNDPAYRLVHNTRCRINMFLKGRHKGASTLAILGIDGKGYKEYIENLFTEGMTWGNQGEWEVDHIYPVSKGGSFHYTNTQPLWKEENREKGDKILGYVK